MTTETAPQVRCSNCHHAVTPAPNAWGWVHTEDGKIECATATNDRKVEVRNLVGIAELAELTGQPGNTVAQQFRRGQLPEPTATLRMGPVWQRFGAIEEWIEARRAR